MTQEEALKVLMKMRAWRAWGKEQKEEERPEMPEQKEVDEAFNICIKLLQEQLPLPSNLYVAARRYAIPAYIKDVDENYLDEYPYSPISESDFKAGAKWDAGQGVSMLGRVGIYGVDVESITKELREAGFNLGEEIILQIRKKQ